MVHSERPIAGTHFLAGGGEMGERIRAFDWSKSPLGPAESWSPTLRTVVRLMLAVHGNKGEANDTLFAVAKWHHVVGPGVQDDRAGLHRPGSAVLPPGRAEKDEPGVPAVDVHGDGPALAGADDRLGPVPIILSLGDPDRLGEVFVRQFRVDDLVAVLGQVARLDPARDRLPAVEEEDYHGVFVASVSGGAVKPPLR